jgi:hypothetical protein
MTNHVDKIRATELWAKKFCHSSNVFSIPVSHQAKKKFTTKKIIISNFFRNYVRKMSGNLRKMACDAYREEGFPSVLFKTCYRYAMPGNRFNTGTAFDAEILLLS